MIVGGIESLQVYEKSTMVHRFPFSFLSTMSVSEAIQEQLQSKDQSVRNAFEQALKMIEGDKKVVEGEQEKKTRSVIRKDIQEWVKKWTTR